MEEFDGLARCLREVDTGVEQDGLRRHAGSFESGQLVVEERRHVVRHAVGVPIGFEQLDLRRPDRVHEHESGLPAGDDLGESRVMERRDVVDDVGAGTQARVGNGGLVRVDRQQTVGAGPDGLDQGHEARRLLLDSEFGRLGVGGLPADVDQQRARLELTNGQSCLGLDAGRTIPREGLGTGVDDAHQRRTVDDDGPAPGGEGSAHGSRS